MSELPPRVALTNLQEGQSHVILSPKTPGKVIAQVMLQEGVYYLTGPHFNDLFDYTLKTIQVTGSEAKTDTALTFELMNELLKEHGASPEATIFSCPNLDDALHTLQGLFKAYSARVVGEAVISNCGRYRYLLTRTWNKAKPPVVFVMLNPSTADDSIDDPTIRRCMGFAQAWGYGGIVVVNLYGMRATNPRDLERTFQESTHPLPALEIIGPENDVHVERALREAGLVVAAWGATPVPGIGQRVQVIRRLAQGTGNRLLCLSITKGGHPGHPLYQPANQPLQTYN